MYIYKITNKINGKNYIGQTIGNVESRWTRHKNDAISGRLNTHFARGIRKHGVENFSLETIDTAETQEELNKKEQYWIHYYNAIRNGYNETDSVNKSGGNTYAAKTEEELKEIGNKIRASKLGGENPHSTKVKCKNVLSGEELHFNSQAEMMEYFNETNHQFISRRCLGRIKSLYKKQWAIAYENSDYNPEYTPQKNIHRAKSISVIDLSTNESKDFPSYAEAERYFNQKPRAFSSKAYKRGNEFVYKNKYKIVKNYE